MSFKAFTCVTEGHRYYYENPEGCIRLISGLYCVSAPSHEVLLSNIQFLGDTADNISFIIDGLKKNFSSKRYWKYRARKTISPFGS